MAAGSLADDCCSEELAALVEHGLVDHLIRPPQHRLRDRQAQRLRRLEIDDELEPRGLLHRKVARPGAFEKLVDVARSVSELVEDARTEAHKSSCLCEFTELGSHGHPMPPA